MENEKIIIVSKQNDMIKTISIIIIIIAGIIALNNVISMNHAKKSYEAQLKVYDSVKSLSEIDSSFDNSRVTKAGRDAEADKGKVIIYGIIVGVSVATIVICVISILYTLKTELVVTDKRVYGIAAFGKRVDIPIDAISVVAKGFLFSVIVASSSGKIVFAGLENQVEIHNVISELLIERQGNINSVIDNNKISEADELMKFKQLLDCGGISQEEYEAKKKQLLDL